MASNNTFDLEIQANKVLKKMLERRGYTDIEESKEDFTLKATKDVKKMISFICTQEKLSIQGIKDFMSVMNRENCNCCIIVYRESVTSSAKKSLEIMEYNIELFSIRELQFDITEHRLSQKHEHVTPEEKKELDEKYKGRLQVLLHTDAMCRYHAFQRNQYVRITRKGGLVVYRIVK
jgi:DNA-directed RNA polymerase subunit H (RpoH/RPB5)